MTGKPVSWSLSKRSGESQEEDRPLPQGGARQSATGLSFPEVGLQQCPTEKNRPRRANSRPARPFSRPNPHADRRECRAFDLPPPQFTTEIDSLLEQSGFELRVPKAKAVYRFAYESARSAL